MANPSRLATPDNDSLLSSLLSLSDVERAEVLNSLSDDEAARFLYDWELWRRPLVTHEDGTFGGQTPPPGSWRWWLILAGRGYGKTWSGAQFIRWKVESGQAGRIALVGETSADVRDVMVEGESGLLAISAPHFRPQYQPSKRRVVWPNGAVATTFSGDAPDQLRGPEHDAAWCDEPAKWKYPQDAWDNLEFGLRLGAHPQGVATTTPRPIPLIKDLVADSDTVVTRGSTYENEANLAASFIRRILKKYEGTRLGRQELAAEILDDNPHALWNRAQIEALRVTTPATDLVRVVVGVDPPATGAQAGTDDDEGGAECGIIVAGLGADSCGYVLADYSLRGSPNDWGRAVVTAAQMFHADRVIGEVNNGGDMVGYVVATAATAAQVYVPYKAVRATRGKYLRAEPVAALYEQSRVKHVGMFALLEDQQCEWQIGQKSPDRLDALVWALTELMLPDGDDDTPAAGPPIILSGHRD